MALQRRKWSTVAMLSAIQAVLRNEMGFLKSARAHNVPLTTLKDYVHQIRKKVITRKVDNFKSFILKCFDNSGNTFLLYAEYSCIKDSHNR